jgi:uncharacterized membrane protein YadS
MLIIPTIALLSYMFTSLQITEEQVEEEIYLPWFIHNENMTNSDKCTIS